MPSFDLTPQAFTAPTEEAPFMTVTFRVPPQTRSGSSHAADPIYPASELQLSVENNHREAFLEQRLTCRDLHLSASNSSGEEGVCVAARVPAAEIPRFSGPRGRADRMVVVKMHAWRGERWLGSWEVGRMEAPLGR